MPKVYLDKEDDQYLLVEETSPGTFRVVRNRIDDHGGALRDWERYAFINFDAEVENIESDDDDDRAYWYSLPNGASLHLRWKDVEMRPREFKAPSVERLQEALRHVSVYAFNPHDD